MAHPTVKELTARYACSRRTIFRMRALGIDVANPVEVAGHVLENPSPTAEMVNAVAKALQEIPSDQNPHIQ